MRCSGGQFDPAIVEVFLRMPEERWINLRREVEGRFLRHPRVPV